MAFDVLLRRSAWQSLQDKVTPLLAGLIALSDANSNLSHVVNTPEEHWTNKLWRKMLESPAAIP